MNIGFLPLLIKLSWRSIWSHRVKSVVVGCIIFIGVFFLVLTDAMMTSVNLAMEKSLTKSITGHIQLFDSEARDTLTMLGMAGNLGADPNVGRIENFGKVKAVIEQHPNVEQVVPMGTDFALVFRGNVIDQNSEALRDALKENDPVKFEKAKTKIIDIVNSLADQYQYTIEISRDRERSEGELADLRYVGSEEYWRDLDLDTDSKLMFLESKVAPLVTDMQPLFLQFLATDIDHYKEAFSYFSLVKGEMVPEGGRGLLVNHEQYEFAFKDRMARLFDSIKFEITVKENGPLATNYELKSRIERRQLEVHEWLLGQDPVKTDQMKDVLAQYLGDDESDLENLFQQFITLNDENFFERFDFFQASLAPFINLYPIDVGDMITLNKLGSGSSVRIRFYGTYHFKGLEHSGFSGFYNLIDLTSFREMHGFASLAQLDEMEEIKAEAGAGLIDPDSVIDDLFGEGSSLEIEEDAMSSRAFDAIEDIQVVNIETRMKALAAERYTRQELEDGPTLSASIILKDRSKLKQTQKELDELIAANNLQVQSIDWQEAAGFVGQMITVMQVVLYTFIIFVFGVATVIINNAMFMATIQRFTEIGTLRAIGASQNVIMGMFLCESILLAVIAGALGLGAAAGLVMYFGDVGIMAPKPEVHFLFGGDRLYPMIGLENIYLGLIVVFVVSVGATLYPAIYATRIPPLVAMTARE